MAQKINTLNLRLNKRLNWNNQSCVHDFNDYSNNVLNLSNILYASKNIAFNLRLTQNIIRAVKTSKNYKINSVMLNQKFFIDLFKGICITKKTTNNFISYHKKCIRLFCMIFKGFMLTQNQLSYNLTDINAQKFLWKNKMFKSKFLKLFPKIFTEFSKIQLTTIDHLSFHGNNFGLSLQKKLINLLNVFLKIFKYDLLGIKILCFGKWKKTNTGRKQKIVLKFGQTRTSNIADKILYHSIAQKTKYGICSIKIWIIHKS